MDRVELSRIFEAVKENHRLLDNCLNHDFSIHVDTKTIGKRYRCIHCSGMIVAIERSWYLKERASTKRDSTIIIYKIIKIF